LSQLSVNGEARPPFTLQQGIIRYKGRIWLGTNISLQQQVIAALHDSVVGGQYVQQCVVCLQAKPDRSRYPGLLEPLPVPSSAWEIISLDFVEGLPLSGGSNSILVVVDKYSKFAHFLPLRHPFTTASVASVHGPYL